MDCKFQTMVELYKAYEAMSDRIMEQIDSEVLHLENGISELKELLNKPDTAITTVGPDLLTRNQGLKHVIYFAPPVYLFSFSPSVFQTCWTLIFF